MADDEMKHIQIDFPLPPQEGTLDCAKHGPGSPATAPDASHKVFCRLCWEEGIRALPNFPPVKLTEQ